MTGEPRRDRDEIAELMHRYAWMVDERRWELADQVFAEGATLDYTSTGGQKGPYRETLAWLDRALAPWPLNLHHITNLSVELAGDAASARTAFFAPMGRERPDGSHDVITTVGYYLDRLVRTPRGWRIAERVCQQKLRIGALPEGYEIPR
jgi:SnoaL-like protein